MGILQKAAETYDHMSALVGKPIEKKATLAPIGFITGKAQIEITIDDSGKFVCAQKIDEKIIFPSTQASAGRTSGAALRPHPLFDKMLYMLRENSESYNEYVNQLQEWCDSEFSNERVNAVLKYVRSGTIKQDVGDLSEEGHNEFVCFRVLSGNTEKCGRDALWENEDVIRSYENFCRKKAENMPKSVCYVTGETVPIAEQHLKGVVAYNANAKIISANDDKNFTYRGRFLNDGEALTVGFETSQKAHNVLKWIAENDGVSFGGKKLICWNPRGKEIPKPIYSLLSFDDEEENTETTPTAYKEKLRKIIAGYKSDADFEDVAVTAAFEAATNGRLSVTYYNEMSLSDYLDRLHKWDETCVWQFGKAGVRSPSLKKIIQSAFGVQRGDDENAKTEVDGKLEAQQTQRLLICRLNGSPFPEDILRATVMKCENLQILNQKNRNSQISVACAIIKKYRYDHYKEEWEMALEPEKKDRSYQYGRLLAVMEKAERDTYDNGEKREPNAIRMQSVFVKRPMYATRIVMEQLKKSYYPRLLVGQRVYYDRLVGEIMERISDCGENAADLPLSETYLMGYYLQKNALYTKKTNENENETEEN